MKKTNDQRYFEQQIDVRFRHICRLSTQLTAFEDAYERGKKFKNVHDVKLTLGGVYLVRRRWKKSEKSKGDVSTPALAIWDETGWRSIDGVVPHASGSWDTLEVWC